MCYEGDLGAGRGRFGCARRGYCKRLVAEGGIWGVVVLGGEIFEGWFVLAGDVRVMVYSLRATECYKMQYHAF